MVGDDAKDAPTLRHRLALGEANGGVVLRQCDDPRAGILGQTAEPGGPGRPVGAEHLTAGIHDRLLPGPADDRRHRGEGDILEVAGPEYYLLRVVEDVDAGRSSVSAEESAEARLRFRSRMSRSTAR